MWGGTRGREAPSIATQSLFIVVSQSEHLGEERSPDARLPLLLHQLTRHPPPTTCQPGQSGGGKILHLLLGNLGTNQVEASGEVGRSGTLLTRHDVPELPAAQTLSLPCFAFPLRHICNFILFT